MFGAINCGQFNSGIIFECFGGGGIFGLCFLAMTAPCDEANNGINRYLFKTTTKKIISSKSLTWGIEHRQHVLLLF